MSRLNPEEEKLKEKYRKKKKEIEQHRIKCSNTHIIKSQKKRRKNGTQAIFEGTNYQYEK